MSPGLFLHLLPGSQPADVGWALGGAPVGTWLKVADAALVPVARNLGARTYLRPCFLPGDDGEGDCADGAVWAAKVIAAIQAAGGTWPAAIGYRNELQATAANAAEYQRYRAALRAAGYAGLVVYGSFAVGQPDWPDYATIPADADALELHEYWDLTVVGSSPWWALRHQEATQRGLLPLTMRLFIGECGSDRIPGGTQASIEDAPRNRRGWNDAGKLSADDQATNLRSYAASCLPNVQAAFVFADGAPNPQWDAYRVRGTPLEAVIRGTWGEVVMTDYSKAQWVPSPNFWQGRTDAATGQAYQPTIVVLHGTAGPNAWTWFQNPQSQVSTHYVVDVDGTVYQCVSEADSAWGNGVVTANSNYAGGPNPNLFSISIEHTRDATNTSPITPAQLAASLDLCRDLLRRHPTVTAFVPHDAIDVGRVCPGPGFPLEQFAALLRPPAPTPDQDALDYYQQRGVRIDASHAIWTAALLPLYRFWQARDAAKDAMADLVKPGPMVAPEAGYQWGGTRPAAVVRLTNRSIGVYLDTSGVWRPFQQELT